MPFANFISVQNKKLCDGDQPFYFMGANCYYLLTCAAAGGEDKKIAESPLQNALNMGIKVLRIWAFRDGHLPLSLQPSPEKYSERVFEGLDWVVSRCGELGIRLVMCLTNYWPDDGGMLQYVKWAKPKLKKPVSEDFYGCVQAKNWYREFVAAVVGRVNTIKNVQYSEDPTIMSWELANEARDHGFRYDTSVAKWIDDTSTFIKSLDPNHLVCIGGEGFFDADSPQFIYSEPRYSQYEGTDFVVNGKIKNVDYLCVHVWPLHWLPATTSQVGVVQFAQMFLRAHSSAAKYIGKPLVLEEFGYLCQNPIEKYGYYLSVLMYVYNQIIQDKNCPYQGAMFWMLSDSQIKYSTRYAIYPPNQYPNDLQPVGNESSAEIIVQIAQLLNNYNNIEFTQLRMKSKKISIWKNIVKLFKC
eukprot:TRINITY_DN7555_c0_g1_i2.p2 TRINITY_DN7555_c0_g1~~TRINITY_DN7555_c0_g1_i2.p2  ORF type:complete len:413 (-),score=33.57 TRINITY_DN7555_c0_g1_i2:126-1364(-)